jgi:hypothetical protein
LFESLSIELFSTLSEPRFAHCPPRAHPDFTSSSPWFRRTAELVLHEMHPDTKGSK